MPSIDIRHRTASTRDLSNIWELAAFERIVGACVRLSGGPVVEIVLPVASESRKRHGAYAITRLDDTRFRIMPAIWVRDDERGAWGSRTSAFDVRLPLWPIVLLGASAEVAEQLARC